METIGFTKEQEKLLEAFADASDELFDLGVITTDSFTGEIGEYVACQYFKLKKVPRVTQAIDAMDAQFNRYQIKAKVISSVEKFAYNITGLSVHAFDFLIVVYFDKNYMPLRMLKIPSCKMEGTTYRVTKEVAVGYACDITGFKLPGKVQSAIGRFAETYRQLEEKKIIKSRKIVGDIGEFYACRALNLRLCPNQNAKGYDADNEQGYRFEIKTRRVYESGRREGKSRRLNNLVGKDADYLVVVTIDRAFRCSGMWVMPMRNVVNPQSAHLGIVNTTPGVKNVVPSKVSWLQTGERFRPFSK